jgi:hypothetical protein
MSKLIAVVALIVAVGLAVPAFAGDVVDMPTGNMVAKDNLELNYIYWDLEAPVPAAPDYIHIGEAFLGITDWLELDAIVADVEGVDTFIKFNAYARIINEGGPLKPSVILGATNFTGSNWPGNDDASPFILSACNLLVPSGPPKFTDPLVRAHLAWGTEAHGDRVFGGLQFLVTPQLGGAVFVYQNDMSYVGVYRPFKQWEFRAGFKDTDPFYSVGGFFGW